MGDFSEAFMLMFRLLGSGDPELLGIIQLSLQISFGATVLAALIGLPLGAAVEYRKHKRPISGFQAVAGTAAGQSLALAEDAPVFRGNKLGQIAKKCGSACVHASDFAKVRQCFLLQFECVLDSDDDNGHQEKDDRRMNRRMGCLVAHAAIFA